MNNRLKQFAKPTLWPEQPARGFGNISSVFCEESEWGEPHAGFKSAYSAAMIRELIHTLSGKTHENAELHEKIDELEERVDKHEQLLKEIFDPTNLPVYGTFEQWRASGEPANPYRGKHVAFIVGKGVIASSDSLDELTESVEKKGKPEGLIIGFVPVASALVSKC
jgi:hypothetical protein